MKNLLKIIKNDMKWGDLLIIGIVLVLGFSLWINLVMGYSSEAGLCEIVVRGEVIAEYNLETMEKDFLSDNLYSFVDEFDEEVSQDSIIIHISSSGIDFELFIQDGQIKFQESNCPDQVCVATGFINRSGEIAACVPAGVLVRIVGGYESDDPDFIAG